MYFTTIIIPNKPNYMLFARDNSKTSRNGKKEQKKIQHANTNQKQAHTNNKV